MQTTTCNSRVSIRHSQTKGFGTISHRRSLFALNLRCNAETSIDGPPAATTAAAAPKLTQLTIKKPLGLVLAENKPTGEVFVEEITPNGNAAATGKIQVGDVVVKTSATVLKSGKDGSMSAGHGERLYDNWETVEFDCTGQDFNTVLAAIGSNNERWGIRTVTLTLRREEEK